MTRLKLFLLLSLTIFFFFLIFFTRPFYHTPYAHNAYAKKVRSIKNTGFPIFLWSHLKPVKEINNDKAIDEYLKRIHFNGSAIIVKDGKIIINKGYGFRDFVRMLPNNSKTVFYIASISKIFVSTSILQLQDQGKLTIYDTVSKYIPDFPNGDHITLYELLTHTSGLGEHSETDQRISHEQLIKKIENMPVRFPPGITFSYSDSNYTILAYILEKISHESFESYVQKHIFNVANMKDTGFGYQYYREGYQSKGYKIMKGRLFSPSLPDMSELFGCGEIFTTPYDLYLFDRSLYSGRFISQNSLHEMFTPNKDHYGLGIYHDPGSYADHGVLPGWNVLNSFSLNGNKYVILFSNMQNGIKSLGVVNNHLFRMLSPIHN